MKQEYKIIRIWLKTFQELIKKFPVYQDETMVLYFNRVEKEVKNGK